MLSNQYVFGAKYRCPGSFMANIRQRIVHCTRCGGELVHDDNEKYLAALSEFEIIHRNCQISEEPVKV